MSYTNFSYSPVQCESVVKTGQSMEVRATVTNTGKSDGDEVIQLYVIHPQNGQQPIPLCSLKGFHRVSLRAGELKEVVFMLTPEELALTHMTGDVIQKAGALEIFVGGGQPKHAAGSSTSIEMEGENYQVF